MIKIQNGNESGKKATSPLVKNPKNNIIPERDRYKNLFASRLFKRNKIDKLVNIIIVFSSKLFEAAQLTKVIEIQNKRGSQAR